MTESPTHPRAARRSLNRRPCTLDHDLPVLLLRLDHNVLHHGTVGAIRSLGRAGIEVHTQVEGPLAPAARSRYLHRAHPWLTSRDDEAALLLELDRCGAAIGRKALLLCTDDIGALFVAEHAAALAGRFLLPEQPAQLPARVADKASLAAVCAELDIPHPQTCLPSGVEEAAEAVDRFGLPLVAKWSRPWRLHTAPGLRSTTLVHTREAALHLAEEQSRAGSRLVLQRYLPGGKGLDWFFHGYFDRSSTCLVGATGLKIQAWPPHAGLTAMGRWLPNPEVEQLAHRLGKELGYRGVLDLDLRRDPTTGRYHLLDFNPRLGAQFRLFTDDRRLDVVRAAHLDLSGRPVPALRPQYGRVLVAENYSPLCLLRTVGRGGPQRHAPSEGVTDATGHAGARYGRVPTVEAAWFARDDLGPFLAMAHLFARRVGNELVGRLPGSR